MEKPKLDYDDAMMQLKEVRVFKNKHISLLVGILWHIIVFTVIYLAFRYL
jgi:hypothetical protein